MGVVSLYKRVGMVYEMLICNESFLGRIAPNGVLWQGMIPLGGVKFVIFFRHVLSVFIIGRIFTKKGDKLLGFASLG